MAVLGAIAQLGERLICIQEVSSSILLSSTTFKCIDTVYLKVVFLNRDMFFNNLES